MNSQMVVQDLSFSTLRTKENKKLIMMDLIAKWKKKISGAGQGGRRTFDSGLFFIIYKGVPYFFSILVL